MRPGSEEADRSDSKPVRQIENYIDFDPEATSFIYSAEDGVRLYSESQKTEFTIKKPDFTVGRSPSCDLHFDVSSPGAKYIARMHARMLFDYDRWLICDTHSTNGTWLNGNKLESGKWYALHYDDVIDFAHQEKYIFFKTNRSSIYGNEADKASAILTAAMKVFHESDHKDETAFKLILSALIDAPMYVPVEIDLQAMFGDIDPTKLKPGDTISPKSNVRMKIRTINVNGTELVPLFSSSEEANKGPSTSVVCMAPQDYLPKIIRMGKDAVINPFGGNAFIYNQKIISEFVMPIVQNKNKNNENESVNLENLSGRTIGEKYSLKEIIGRGGFFVTYLAVDKSGCQLSVKTCDKMAAGYNSEIRNSILQEPRMMMQFNHPNMPRVLDIIEDERYIYIVRPFIDGRDLRAVIEEKGHLTEEEAVRIAICVANALDCIHKATPGFIFRDVKPQNILITNKNEVILFDFGTAVEIKSGSTSVSIGTRGYAAPEQYTSNYDQRVDIYGLGATLHYMLTGHNPSEPPYELQPITHYYADLSKGLEYVVDRCLKKSPEDRYQDCGSLIEDLRNYNNLPPKKSILSNLFGKKKNKPNPNSVKKESDQTGSGKMKVARCENGHFYNAVQYNKCPHCGAPEKSDVVSDMPTKPSSYPPEPPAMNYPKVTFMCPNCGIWFERYDYHGEEVICGRCKHVIAKGNNKE